MIATNGSSSGSNNAIIPAPSSSPVAKADAFAKYGRSGGGGLFGDLLRHSGRTGTWRAGPQSVEVPAGIALVAIVTEMHGGYTKWEGGEIVAQEMRPVSEGCDLQALRETLGDLDQSQWPRDDSGKPTDPWKECVLLPLKDLKTGACYTFSSSSIGGTRAAKRLAAVYSWQLRASPETAGHLPVVALGSRAYQHSDRKRGTIHNPTLEGIDWVPASVLDNNKGNKADEPPPEVFEDHRSEKTKKHRRASL
jgi:hypothetical protein